MEEETPEVVEETPEPTAAEPAEPAENAEPAPAEEDGSDRPVEPEKKNGVQKRIDELTKARYKAEAEAEYYRSLAEQKQRPAEPAQPQGDIIPPGYPAEPVLEAFEDYDQFNRALVKWEAGRIIAERDYREHQTKVQARQQEVVQGFSAKVEAFKEAHEDFDEALASARGIDFAPVAIETIQESEQGAEIAYHLAKNQAEAKRIAALTPAQQIKEIAKLEVKFATTQAPPPKRVSQAPSPVNPVGSGGNPATKDPDKMSDEEWLAYERSRVAKLGKRY